MVRFLVYVNEFDVEGLIASAGSFANVANKTNILKCSTSTSRCIRIWSGTTPIPALLNCRTVTGRAVTAWARPKSARTPSSLKILGEGKDTGSPEAIIKVVDKPDPRPVWICVWAESREVAQAIWKFRKPAARRKFSAS